MNLPIKSTKIWTAIAAVGLGFIVLVLNNKFDLGLDQTQIKETILYPLTALIVGKGMADFGKASK